MKKHICFIIRDMSNRGGTERVTFQIASSLSKKYQVSYIDFSRDSELFFDVSDHVITESLFHSKINLSKFNYFKIVLKLRKYIIDNKVDILIPVEPELPIITHIACVGTNVKTIYWEHFNYKVNHNKFVTRISRILAAILSNNIVTLTERDNEFWKSNIFTRANIITIGNPCLFDIACPNDKENTKKAIAIGRLSNQKGFDRLIKAWDIVNKSRKDWCLRIIGDGEQKNILIEMIEKFNLQNSIEIISSTKCISQYYNDSSLLIMSSRYEGLPLVLIEASRFGLPTVSFDFDCGARDVIDSNSGWICEQNNINSLADNILIALKTLDDSKNFKKMSIAAWNKSNQYTLDKIIPKWEALLK